MQWVLLIGEKGLSAKDFADMRFINSRKVGLGEGRLSVEYNDNGFAVFSDDDGDISCDLSEQELDRLPFEHPSVVMLQYSSIEILKNIVGSEDLPANVIIDCDGLDLGLDKIIDGQRVIDTSMDGYIRGQL